MWKLGETSWRTNRKATVQGLLSWDGWRSSWVGFTPTWHSEAGATCAEAAAHAARGSWWYSNANRDGRGPHTRQVFAHCHAGFWFCWMCGFCTAQRVKGLAERCRGIEQSRGGVLHKLKDGRNPKDGGWVAEANLACGGSECSGRGPGRRRQTLDGTGVTWCMSWSATGSALISFHSGTTLTSHRSARSVRNFVGLA